MAEADTIADRRPQLSGRMFASEAVSVAVMAPATRLSLRAPDASRGVLGQVLGLSLPEAPKSSASAGGRTALWLGPDEWLLIGEDGGDLASVLAGVTVPHSAVDVSHRDIAIEVRGPAAEAILNAGCPQDLSPVAFPVGACSRTVLAKAGIVLLRTGADAFRVECPRSLADYVFALLESAAWMEG